MRNYLTELIGTFFLVLTVGLTVMNGSPMAPLAIGCSLMIMVYMGGHISGGHYNPAVSLAAMLRGALPARELVPYIVSQLVGAVLAAFVASHLTGSTFAPAPAADASVLQALVVEALFSFALCLVVLQVATNPETEGNSYYGLAIGFTIVVAAFAGGPISGGAFNPAVGFGPILVQAIIAHGSFVDLWLYIVGPAVGAALAAMVFNFQVGKA